MIGNYIFEVFITFIEYFCLFYFLNEQDLKRSWMTIVLQSIPITILITMVNHFLPLSFSAIWLYVVYVSMIIFCFYRRSVRKKILLAGSYLLILLVGEILTMAAFYTMTKESDIAETIIEITHPYRKLYLITVKVVVVCIMILIKKVVEQNPVFHKRVFVFSLGTISILLGYVTSDFVKIHSMFGWIIYAVVAGMFALMLFCIHKWQQADYEKQMLLLQHTAYAEFYDQLRKQEESKNRFVHDFQYYCMTLHQMLKKEQYEESQNYLKQMLALTTNTGNVRYTGNSNFDCILNYKKTMAEIKGIRFVVDADAISEPFPIPSEDMNIIMGNLLDNAIEANEKRSRDNAWIYVKINKVKSMLLITIENTFDSPPVKKGDLFVSGKQDGMVHGLGIKNVTERIEKNQGLLNFKVQDNIFRLEITLFFEDKEMHL